MSLSKPFSPALRQTVALLVWLLMYPLGVFSSSPVTTVDLRETLEEIRQRHEAVGLSVLAMSDGKVVWQEGFGLADTARGIPMTPDTRLRIASISKTVTAAALMQFWEKDRFHLDDDISRHLGFEVVNPNHPDTPVTIRQLLIHTSSLRDGPNYNRFLRDSYQAGENAPAIREILHIEGSYYAGGANFADHPPGEVYSYCNLNYAIIGTLVEIFSGQRFDHYSRENLLKPLGISGSFNAADLDDLDQLAVLYRTGGENPEPAFDNHRGERPPEPAGPNYQPGHNAIIFGPQGGLRASASEVGRWMRMFLERDQPDSVRVLQPATMDLMLAEHWSNGREGTAYRGRGLCFQRTVNVQAGEKWVGHGGRAYGMLAKMYFQKTGDTGILYLSTGSSPGPAHAELHVMERAIYDVVLDWLAPGR